MGILSDQQQQSSSSTRSRSPHIQQQVNHNPSDAFFPPSSASSTSSSHGNHSAPYPPHIHSHPFSSNSHSSTGSRERRRPGSPAMAFPREVNGQGEEVTTDDGHSQATGSTSHHGTQRNGGSEREERAQTPHGDTSLAEPEEETSVTRTMSQSLSARQELTRVDMVAGKKVECGGCSKIIDQSSGGIVVAFG